MTIVGCVSAWSASHCRRRTNILPTILTTIGVLLLPMPVVAQGESDAEALDGSFQSEIRPLLERYCFDCQAAAVTEADLDLAGFKTIAEIRGQTHVWLKVREMLRSGQMPPRDAEQLSEEDRDRLRNWVHRFLAHEAKSSADDPGPVILRRLSNAEYTCTIRDLTGVPALDPTREFPVDGAAGEGFTNVGSGQGMSPALVQKYLDAAKQVAAHAVLLPDGIRFSPSTSRRDQTNELLARIQTFYRQFTEDGGGSAVDLQGIRFDTNQGGRLPLEKYLNATLSEREALISGQKTIDAVARERSLNERYLKALWNALRGDAESESSLLIEAMRQKWRAAGAEDAAAMAAEVRSAQSALWKFNSVGHIGRVGGPTSWMEAVSPITNRQEVRFDLPDSTRAGEVTIFLTAADLNVGKSHDVVIWHRPRIEFQTAAGAAAPPILLRDIRPLARRIERTIQTQTARTQQYLEALQELREISQRQPVEPHGDGAARDRLDSETTLDRVAKSRRLSPVLLARWARLVGFGPSARRGIQGHFTQRLTRVQGNEAINGWGSSQTPSLLTNRSDKPITFLTLTVPARNFIDLVSSLPP
ncbi:MAG: DUF1587 domain-containing protein, partial [Planctomycetes bacterium]|nr:DUF1587 domain-containing protein [Planctomycetota bacterium]